MKSLLQFACLMTLTLTLMGEETEGRSMRCCRRLRCWEKQMKCKNFGSSCRCVDDDVVIGKSGPPKVIDTGNDITSKSEISKQIVQRNSGVDDDTFEGIREPSTVFEKNHVVLDKNAGKRELPRVVQEKELDIDDHLDNVERGPATVFDIKIMDAGNAIVQGKGRPPMVPYKRTTYDIELSEDEMYNVGHEEKRTISEINDVDGDERELAKMAEMLTRMKKAQTRREEEEVYDDKRHAKFNMAQFSLDAIKAKNPHDSTSGSLEVEGQVLILESLEKEQHDSTSGSLAVEEQDSNSGSLAVEKQDFTSGSLAVDEQVSNSGILVQEEPDPTSRGLEYEELDEDKRHANFKMAKLSEAKTKPKNPQESAPEGLEENIEEDKRNAKFKMAKFSEAKTKPENPQESARGGLEEEEIDEDKRHAKFKIAKFTEAETKPKNPQESAPEGLEEGEIEPDKRHAKFKMATFSEAKTKPKNSQESALEGLEEEEIYEDKRHAKFKMAKFSDAAPKVKNAQVSDTRPEAGEVSMPEIAPTFYRRGSKQRNNIQPRYGHGW